MIQTGLLSVTFRQLAPLEIIKLVQEAGLQSIEWGGDIHVPHGDAQKAKEVRDWTVEAGLTVASYGSYYRVGSQQPDRVLFERVLESALALQAPAIRVWAGDKGSAAADEAWWSQVVADSRRISDLAEQAGVRVDFEYHGNTLTDTRETAVRLLQEAGHPNLRCNWQPAVGVTMEERKLDLAAVTPWLTNVHVFHWLPGIRCPLADGIADWTEYMGMVREIGGLHYAMLEFVKDNEPQQFLQDAEILKRLCE
jgi:3-dehydroshikimate dehydratase